MLQRQRRFQLVGSVVQIGGDIQEVIGAADWKQNLEGEGQ